MNEKIMTLPQVNGSPLLWIDVTRDKDFDLVTNNQGRYREVVNSSVGVTLLHRETFKVVEIPEIRNLPLVITRGGKHDGRRPRVIIAYLIPVSFTGEQFEEFKYNHRQGYDE